MSNDPQTASHIAEDDSEVVRVLLGLRKAVYPISVIVNEGPHGRTRLYEDIEAGLLSTFVSGNRRFAYAIDYAKYLVPLKRIGEAKDSRHHLAKPVNRPAHDPRRQRAA